MNVAQERVGYTLIAEAVIEGLLVLGEFLLEVVVSVAESKSEKEEE